MLISKTSVTDYLPPKESYHRAHKEKGGDDDDDDDNDDNNKDCDR